MNKCFYKGHQQSHASDQSLYRLETFRKDVVTDSHTIPLEELCTRLDTDPVSGLNKDRAKDLLKRNGPNALTPSRKTPEYVKFLKITFHGFSILLWVGALLCYGTVILVYFTNYTLDTDNLVLGGSLVFVVLGTSVFMYIMDRQSASVMESFANMVPPKATVIRDGQVAVVNCRELVLGDLVDVKFGDRVPADLRIVHAQGLKVDNSPLTGESEPQSRGNTCTDTNFLETKNIVFFSTSVLEGTGRGIAVACGDHTVMGHIAGLTARLKPNKTPMAKELDRFMKLISVWACTLGVLLGIACLSLQYKAIDTAVFVIGIIVANVPEGLLATVTVCLTVTAKKMAAKNCVVKNLQAVETLGCTSVICSDKTGTLTQNRMTVAHVWFDGKTCASDLSDEQTQAEEQYKRDAGFFLLMRAACLCSRAEFLPNQDHMPVLQRAVRGDASEEAILKFVTISRALGPNYAKKNRKLCEIPFSSSTKFQTSVHSLEDGTVIVVMKGAPEVILERCSCMFYNKDTVNLDSKLKSLCESTCMKFAAMGERVLGFGDLVLEEDRFTENFEYSIEPPNFPQRHLRFLGFMALIDPPRPQVPASIVTCKLAGIKVTMVTGDHPVTARAIARQVGIITAAKVIDLVDSKDYRQMPEFEGGDVAMVIHGSVLKDLQAAELDEILFKQCEMVFARTSPTQKLQIVESYQRLGEIVAVTGDGVNDAPALKKADIGIAMGITGTEVSQQAADIILMDDNFSTIILGIEEGRKIFDNLKKSIVYTLSSNVPEILPFIAFATLSIPLPIGVIAILAIDILTDMMPAISLAYEKAESDIMVRPPRNPQRDRLVSRKLYFLAYGNLGLIETAAGFLVYFVIFAEHGFRPSYLIGLRAPWVDPKNNNLTDSIGRPWTFEEREALEQTCYTGFLAAVVMCQWTNVIVCKTRLNSIYHQGMRNWVLNASLVVETVLVCFLSYCPGMHYMKFRPLKYQWWLCALPFALILFVYDELRKCHIRKYPKGWFQRETYY